MTVAKNKEKQHGTPKRKENMPKETNKQTVKTLKEKLAEAKSVIFAEYTGLDANRMNELRKQIRAEGAELNISKNTLMKIALSEKDEDARKQSQEKGSAKAAKQNHNGDISERLKGQMMALFSYEDAVTPLRKLVEFAKEHETPSVKIGLFEGDVITAEKILELSELPSREELLAKVVGGLKSPLTGIVGVLGGTQRNFVYALSAIAEKRSEE